MCGWKGGMACVEVRSGEGLVECSIVIHSLRSVLMRHVSAWLGAGRVPTIVLAGSPPARVVLANLVMSIV